MLYTLREIVRPGERTAYQIRDPYDMPVVELYDYPVIERLVSRLNVVMRRRTHALGHIDLGHVLNDNLADDRST